MNLKILIRKTSSVLYLPKRHSIWVLVTLVINTRSKGFNSICTFRKRNPVWILRNITCSSIVAQSWIRNQHIQGFVLFISSTPPLPLQTV